MESKKPRGLAAISKERQREIASKGGKAAHASGKAHRFNTAEAVAAGRKGGLATSSLGKRHRFTSEEARLAGHKGGSTTQRRKRELKEAQASVPLLPTSEPAGG